MGKKKKPELKDRINGQDYYVLELPDESKLNQIKWVNRNKEPGLWVSGADIIRDNPPQDHYDHVNPPDEVKARLVHGKREYGVIPAEERERLLKRHKKLKEDSAKK